MPPKIQQRRDRGFCFTYWPGHRPDHTEEEIMTILKAVNCQYIVFQQETGSQPGQTENGEHIQCWVYFKSAITLQQAKGRLPGTPHIEVQRGSNSQAADYCKKDDTRRPGKTWHEVGQQPQDTGVKNNSLLETIQHAEQHGMKRTMDGDEHKASIARYTKGIQTLANHAANKRIPMMRNVKIYYIWGDSGAGKTTWASTRWSPDDTYVVSDRKQTWFDQYQGEGVVVIDEFEGKTDWGLIKRILDGSKMLLPTKGSHVYGEYHTVIVTSNHDPRTFYDQGCNFWTTEPPYGPFQRRVLTGGIHKGTGAYETPAGVVWNPPLPNIGDITWQATQLAAQAPDQDEVDQLVAEILRDPDSFPNPLTAQEQADLLAFNPLVPPTDPGDNLLPELNDDFGYNDVRQDLDGDWDQF